MTGPTPDPLNLIAELRRLADEIHYTGKFSDKPLWVADTMRIAANRLEGIEPGPVRVTAISVDPAGMERLWKERQEAWDEIRASRYPEAGAS